MITPLVILDTDILSEYLKGHDASVVRRGDQYAREHGVFTFTSVTVFEVLAGLEHKDARSQMAKMLAWLDQNNEIPPLGIDYRSAARIKGQAARRGDQVELPDCLIAAIAVRLNRPVVTGNRGDFEKIQRTGIGLKLENWRDKEPPQ